MVFFLHRVILNAGTGIQAFTIKALDKLDVWLKENNLWPFSAFFYNGYVEHKVIAAVVAANIKDLGITLPDHVKKTVNSKIKGQLLALNITCPCLSN